MTVKRYRKGMMWDTETGGYYDPNDYVLASDYDALAARLAEAERELEECREMFRRAQHPELFKVRCVYTQRDGLQYLLPIVGQWGEWPDIFLEVGWSPAFVEPRAADSAADRKDV